ncbi:MAG TPA: guanylate kinase [Spirochaetota bacterium]
MPSSVSVVISAPSGAGKTTLIRELMRKDLRIAFSVSTTTRPRREGEVEGKSYYYIDDETFRGMIDDNQFLEWAKVHSHYYGTSRKEIDRIWGDGKIPLFDVDVQGAKNLRSALPDAVFIFVMPPSVRTLADRLTNRKTENAEELSIRLSNAAREMREFPWYDYVVINDQVERAVSDIESIIHAASLSRDRMRHIAEKIMEEKI